VTDLGDMLAAQHKSLATRGASRYDRAVPDDGAGIDHHEGQEMRKEFGIQVIGLPAGMVPAGALGFGHDCSEHDDESAARIVSTKRAEIENEISEITAAMTAEITKRRAKLDALDAVPTENPTRDGDVVQFVLTMPRAGERAEYTYVGQVANGGMIHLTGRDNEPKSWPEFVDFVTSGPRRMKPGSFVILNRLAVESGDDKGVSGVVGIEPGAAENDASAAIRES
jgi:hypothetical protein